MVATACLLASAVSGQEMGGLVFGKWIIMAVWQSRTVGFSNSQERAMRLTLKLCCLFPYNRQAFVYRRRCAHRGGLQVFIVSGYVCRRCGRVG